MKTFLRGVMLMVAALAISACSNNKETIETIEGSAFYLQRIAMPPNAKLVVSLDDVTLDNGSSISIDRQTFATEAQAMPLQFSFKVPADKIEQDKVYALSASLQTAEGQTVFATIDTYPVLTDANQTAKVELQLFSYPAVTPAAE